MPAPNSRDPRDLLRAAKSDAMRAIGEQLGVPVVDVPLVYTYDDVFYMIAGGYSFATLSVGLALRNPQGREVFIQPGCDETIVRSQIDATQRIRRSSLRDTIAEAIFGEYFS